MNIWKLRYKNSEILKYQNKLFNGRYVFQVSMTTPSASREEISLFSINNEHSSLEDDDLVKCYI